MGREEALPAPDVIVRLRKAPMSALGRLRPIVRSIAAPETGRTVDRTIGRTIGRAIDRTIGRTIDRTIG